MRLYFVDSDWEVPFKADLTVYTNVDISGIIHVHVDNVYLGSGRSCNS